MKIRHRFIWGFRFALVLVVLVTGAFPAIAQSTDRPSEPVEVDALRPTVLGDALIFVGIEPGQATCDEGMLVDIFINLTDEHSLYTAEAVLVINGVRYLVEKLEGFTQVYNGENFFIIANNLNNIPDSFFPLPGNTPLTLEMTLYAGITRLPVYRTVITYRCNTGSADVIFSGPLSPAPAIWGFVDIKSFGCDSKSSGNPFTSLATFLSVESGKTYFLDVTVSSGNDVYMDYYRSINDLNSGMRDLELDAANDQGKKNRDFPMDSSDIITVDFKLLNADEVEIYAGHYAFNCQTGYEPPDKPPTGTPVNPLPVISPMEVFPACNLAPTPPEFDFYLSLDAQDTYNYEAKIIRFGHEYFKEVQPLPVRSGVHTFQLTCSGGCDVPFQPLPVGLPVRAIFTIYKTSAPNIPIASTGVTFLCSDEPNSIWTDTYLPLNKKS